MAMKKNITATVDKYAQNVVEGRVKPIPNMDAFIYYKVLKR